MPITKKQQIRGTRILLTVFYGFLLSSILFRYIIHGIVETVRRPSNPYAITMLVLGSLILISIGLAIYATWFDNALLMLVSGIVLICVFILTLVFGIVRIINTAPLRIAETTTLPNDVWNDDGSADASRTVAKHKAGNQIDNYTIIEDVIKLIVELISILFAVLATFILYRYVKSKYAAVPTADPKPAT